MALHGGKVDIEPSDEELFLRYRQGERQTFETLVLRYERGLFNFVLRQIHVASTAEDIVQEAFLRVVQNAKTFKEEARFSTWLFTIARNLCIDFLRKRAHRRHASLDAREQHGDEEGPALGERIASPGISGDRIAIGHQLQDHITHAIDLLPEEQREVFLLRQIGELPFKDIADMLKISENTVKSRMRYALERLQLALNEYEDYVQNLG